MKNLLIKFLFGLVLLSPTDCLALEEWKVTALKHDLIDYNEWAIHAIYVKLYPDISTALTYKAERCAKRMILEYESQYGILYNKTIEDKVLFIAKIDTYLNRKERDALEFINLIGGI